MLKRIFQLIGLKIWQPKPEHAGRCSLCGAELFSDQPISPYAECASCFIEMNELDNKVIEEHEKARNE
ncbi:MAG: hypothetical protein NTY98_05280, partial [Verrucomicrobia bacterium]|nr:hypothetical protein [Verrucomicrobiota bacterium]